MDTRGDTDRKAVITTICQKLKAIDKTQPEISFEGQRVPEEQTYVGLT